MYHSFVSNVRAGYDLQLQAVERCQTWNRDDLFILFLSNKCVFCDKRFIWIDRVHTVQAFETVSILATVQNEAYGTLYFQTFFILPIKQNTNSVTNV